MERKIALIDGYSLLFRAFHALPMMDNGEGEYTNAVYGFMSMLLKILETEQPDALAVAFDVDKHTFRHESYDRYKAGRAPTPEEMKGQIDLVKELLSLMGIPMLSVQGYEADDVLGTVSRICEEEKIRALIVTGDRDSYQLAGEYTSIMYTKKGITETELVTPEWIRDKYGLRPEQLIDVKSLMGDASDNIPGVPGIGEKTAVKLINQYQTLENVLDKAAEEQKGALREKLITGRDSALMSRFLAEINRRVPVEFDFDACRVGTFEKALPLLRRLKLRSVMERMKQAGLCEKEESTAEKVLPPAEAETVSAAVLPEALEHLREGAKYIAFDIGEKFSAASDTGACLCVSLGGDLLDPGLGEKELFEALGPVLRDEKITLLVHNVKALDTDIGVLEGRCEDTMLAAYVINPQAECRSLPDACRTLDALWQEGCPARSVLEMWNKAEKRLKEDGLMRLYREVELPLCFVLRDMENEGFRVDTQYLRELGEIYRQRIEEETQKIYALAGRSVNLNSPKQLKQLLFEDLGLPVPGGKKNAGSTAADVLEALAADYPICACILEYRKYQKLSSTYIDGLLSQVGEDGRVHTRFEQAVTGTGRISSREPNLQNIPVRTELGREIRRAFIPREGWVLVDADYSQIELRVLAAMSGDETMRRAFLSGQDIHASTASEIFKTPVEEVTGELRSRAKAVNFGVVYGISEYGLAKNTGVGVKEAASFISSYFARYPAVKRFMDEKVAEGRENGYVKTLLGRRRYLPELSSGAYQMRSFGERAAMNSPIQGTAADIIKVAMVNTARELKRQGLRTRLILQVHDELIMESPQEEAERAMELLKRCMEGAAELDVPLLSEAKMGGNWNECKP